MTWWGASWGTSWGSSWGSSIEYAALSGSSSFSFTADGRIQGAGRLAGLTAFSFSSTGSIISFGRVSGSTSVTFTGFASAQARGALSGSASLTFAAAAVASSSFYTPRPVRGARQNSVPRNAVSRLVVRMALSPRGAHSAISRRR